MVVAAALGQAVETEMLVPRVPSPQQMPAVLGCRAVLLFTLIFFRLQDL